MKVISHRGYWKEPSEKNTEVAFRRSFDLGFGTETDVRDLAGTLVISHDMPTGGEMPLDTFLSLSGVRELTLALNIKADGLADRVVEAARRHQLRDWFVFDMSVPDMRAYLKLGAPVFSRMSEVERVPAWVDQAAGIWLDSFSLEWWDAAVLRDLLAGAKRVCVVSPELHGRGHTAMWATLAEFRQHDNLVLCTDLPEQARHYFGKPND